ncbi:putative plant snare 11 [Arabis alpina]|uniref:Plant snare 11 n=1 Tax=Arabis alpina TaxID=50452 RepID=A0A087GHN8_ARAAL|nr:putative plant snare 11 [Arabis alpina]
MDPISAVSEELAEIEGQINDLFRALSNGFQKLEKIKDANRQSRQLEELTDKMRDCKSLIKDFDKEVKSLETVNDANTNRMLNDRRQSMVKELNSYVALKKKYSSNLASNNKRVDLFDGPAEDHMEENVLLASKYLIIPDMSNQELMDKGNSMMDDTDQAIERGKKIVQETINVGTDTSAALKAQTEQMSRVVNELDSIHFSLKKASKLVKEIGRQVATDKCIMAFLFLIVIGVIAMIIVKIVNPNNKDIRDIPGLAPPAMNRHETASSHEKKSTGFVISMALGCCAFEKLQESNSLSL